MDMTPRRWLLLCGGALFVAAACIGTPEPAQAQFGGIGIGGFPGGINIYLGPRYRGRHRGRGRGSQEEQGSDGGRAGKPESVAVSKGAPSSAEQMNALRYRVAATAVSANVGSTKDLFEVGQTTSNEVDRDYMRKIEVILDKFDKAQAKANDDTAGDVTMNAIEAALEKAFKSAQLDVYGRFAGESWTSERVRKMILDLVDIELPRLFRGNNHGNAPMSALDALIQKAAESVYRRIFETSELLAANRSSALFMQRLYQTHGSLVTNRLRESADTMIMRAALGAIRPYESAMRRGDNGYADRYRAQRIVFDCLSENVARISSAEQGIDEIEAIEGKIAKTSTEICSKWLKNQFGSEKDIAPQKPIPLRAVWSEKEPKVNPSMYNNSLGTL